MDSLLVVYPLQLIGCVREDQRNKRLFCKKCPLKKEGTCITKTELVRSSKVFDVRR